MNSNTKELIINNEEFQSLIKDLVDNATVQKMKIYRQHFDTNCFDHCYRVAYYCFYICKKWNLDYRAVARAAMLHDLFLYDWRVKDSRNNLHAFTHGKIACENASKLFKLNEKEKDIIIKHMWPVTFAFPKSREGFVLTLIDKYCTLIESCDGMVHMILNTKCLRYAYMLIGILFFKTRN